MEQLDTQSVEDMFTGQYLWTDDIQSVYDSVKNGNWNSTNEFVGENNSAIIDGSTYWWQEGANEDARGAEITLAYDSTGQLWINGKSWNSANSVDIYYFVTNVYEDGSMVVECFDEENAATLYILPTENGGIFVEQEGVFYGEEYLRFDGVYQMRQ